MMYYIQVNKVNKGEIMTGLLIKLFVPNYTQTNDQKVRQRYGFLGGMVGIIVNIILFAVKFLTGLGVNSISLMADAFNNLSDVASSVVTIWGFVLSGRPADEKHPFGHGRLEYITGLIVAFMVILIGYEFIKSSFERILNPTAVLYSHIALIIIVISILFKGWLAYFNKKLASAIDSHALSASSFDSFSDMISTGCVGISLLASRWTNLPIDGYIGVLVAGIILYAGISLTKETISPLVGEASPGELARKVANKVLSYEGINNVHDLIIHNYGPGRYMASIHAEVSADSDIMELHELIDKVEREAAQELDILLTIHMDPINTNCKETNVLQQEMSSILQGMPEVLSFHDFRVVGKDEVRNLLFDIVVRPGMTETEERRITEKINSLVKEKHPDFNCVIGVDKEYAAME